MGFVAKAHGIRGEVLVGLTTDRTERVAPGMVLETQDGRRLEVERSSAHQGRFIVAFAGVATRSDAEGLKGEALLAEPLDDPGTLWVHQMIGAQVVDAAGKVLGSVESVEANPASDLLVLGGGELIPLTFVVSHEPGRLVVDVPVGLLDDDTDTEGTEG